MTKQKLELNTQPLKQYHTRYYKVLSILKYFQRNAINYNQTKILNTLNFFLKKDDIKITTLRTLRQDLCFLCKNGIIEKTLIRLGKGNGSYIRYTVNKYSNNNLNRLLESKQSIVEHDANAIYKFTKKTQKKYLQNKKVKIYKPKNATKNVSHIINNKKEIKNKRKNDIIFKISKVAKGKTMKYLDKIEENKNKKRYEESILKVKNWLKQSKLAEFANRGYDNQSNKEE
ncbi:putative cytosolic protein [Borrelia duttonii CR2A]|uniref:Putative cytosolic protein n=1 Tax=Borrelia duttonii CR2A TaxID=1432657 RepID=W6TGQ9_9SPIR|nr:plasmid maintenance protein [Borrelia duttonii]ETZ17635.1 putative cytosolic protein [Borrelia duttonii CR2A]